MQANEEYQHTVTTPEHTVTWQGSMPENTTIWVMDSDICEDCDALLDEFGCCPNCGWGELDDLYFDEEDDIDEYALDFDEQGHYIGG